MRAVTVAVHCAPTRRDIIHACGSTSTEIRLREVDARVHDVDGDTGARNGVRVRLAERTAALVDAIEAPGRVVLRGREGDDLILLDGLDVRIGEECLRGSIVNEDDGAVEHPVENCLHDNTRHRVQRLRACTPIERCGPIAHDVTPGNHGGTATLIPARVRWCSGGGRSDRCAFRAGGQRIGDGCDRCSSTHDVWWNCGGGSSGYTRHEPSWE